MAPLAEEQMACATQCLCHTAATVIKGAVGEGGCREAPWPLLCRRSSCSCRGARANLKPAASFCTAAFSCVIPVLLPWWGGGPACLDTFLVGGAATSISMLPYARFKFAKRDMANVDVLCFGFCVSTALHDGGGHAFLLPLLCGPHRKTPAARRHPRAVARVLR